VKPETLIRWHRKGFRLFWHWKSAATGRPCIPADVQRLIATMAAANRTWGEERIANELLLKLGLKVSPRTVRRYMRPRPRRPNPGTQAWRTFVRNHARCVLGGLTVPRVTSKAVRRVDRYITSLPRLALGSLPAGPRLGARSSLTFTSRLALAYHGAGP
jgi:hypothetical protein